MFILAISCLWFAFFFSLHAYELAPVYVEKDSLNEPQRSSAWTENANDTYYFPETRSHQGMDLAGILEQVPGVIINRSGGTQQASIHLRGAPADHTLVIVDGVVLNDPSSVNRSFDASSLLMGNIKSIKVSRGNAFGLYGVGANAGVIEIETYKGERPSSVSLMGGRAEGISMKASIAGEKNLMHLSVQGQRYRGESAAISGSEKDDKKTLDAKLSYLGNLGELVMLEANVGFYQGITDEDSVDEKGSPVDSDLNRSFYTRYLSMLKLRQKKLWGSFFYRISAQLVRRESRFDDQAEQFEGENSQHRFQADIKGVEWSATAGLDLHDEKSLVSSEMSERAQTLSAFLLGRRIFSQKNRELTSLSSSFRWTSFSAHSDELSVALSLEKRLHEHQWSVSYAQAVKAPSLYQLYGPSFGGFRIGNKELIPEKSENIEMSYGYGSVLQMNLFRYVIKDYIQFSGVEGYQNSSNWNHYGAELSLMMRIGAWNLDSSFMWLQFVADSDEKVLRRPRENVNLNLAYDFNDDFTIRLQYLWRGKSYDRILGAYTQLSEQEFFSLYLNRKLALERKFSRVEWQLGAQNLFRQNTVSSFGYTGTPFTLIARLTYFY